MPGVYKGKLELDRIVGIRNDRNQKATPVQRLLKEKRTASC